MSRSTQDESTLTNRYQTTIPRSVRETLGLHRGDKLRYRLHEDGRVILERAGDADPALGPFLDLLEQDMARHPGLIRALDADLGQRLQSLTEGIEVDLDVTLPADDE
jgi:antitoxin PrlF